MGTFSLICHPKTPPSCVSKVTVDWAVKGPMLVLTYRVVGAGALVLPAKAAPERSDGLWKTTCFELFAGFAGKAYREFNFSPSTCWAAYDFSDYREGGGNASTTTPPVLAVSHAGDEATCTVTLPHGLIEGASVAGLTAVIAEQGGYTSYWALAHDGARPDFHKRSCFTLAIGAAEAP